MKLHILSDLHLEFSDYEANPVADEADVIVLAGDIWLKDKGIYWARKTWPRKEIVYVAGNHEFYGQDRSRVISMLEVAAKNEGVHFLENRSVTIDGVRILGATLWTDFGLFGELLKLECMRDAERGLNDFHLIHEGDEHFTPENALSTHLESVSWLQRQLKEESYVGKTVVVTHHLPSALSVAGQYRRDSLSACFASHLDYLIERSDLWIHGHTHDSFSYAIGNSRVICNPRGYAIGGGLPENLEFDPELLLVLDPDA